MPYYIKRKKTEGAKKPKKREKPNLIDKLDRVFSAYIRLRDVMPNGYFRCISCGHIKPFAEADAGHFFSRRHMATRFDETNVWSECRGCNRFSADHIIAYQANLIKKIGMSRFELLRVKANGSRQWSDFELEAMIKHYTAELKRLSAAKGIKVRI